MSDIRTIPDAVLLAEVERRKRSSKTPPVPVVQPDFTSLVRTVTGGVEKSVADGYERDDFASYVYEEALTAVFGKDYWTWRRAQKW